MRAFLAFCLAGGLVSGAAFAAGVEPKPADVLGTYGEIAHAAYEDSFITAKALQASVNALLADPSPAKLAAARAAWKAARIPYLQTEAFRFGNKIVDAWEGRVNSWPLDEGLIDYVATSYGKTSDENPLYTLNVIANKQIRIGAKQLNATVIDKNLLRQLQHAQGVDVQRRHRLSRHRVSAVGPGPARHRPRRRRTAGQRLRSESLHARQLRPPRRVPQSRDRSSGRGYGDDDGRLGGGRQGAG